MSIYGPPHPPPPGPTPEEARAALALTEAPTIPVRARDLALCAVGTAGFQVAVLMAVFGTLPESWPAMLAAGVVGAAVIPFVLLQNFVRSVPRGFKTKAGLAGLVASWFAIWVHSMSWQLGVQLAVVAAGFTLAITTVVLLGLRRR